MGPALTKRQAPPAELGSRQCSTSISVARRSAPLADEAGGLCLRKREVGWMSGLTSNLSTLAGPATQDEEGTGDLRWMCLGPDPLKGLSIQSGTPRSGTCAPLLRIRPTDCVCGRPAGAGGGCRRRAVMMDEASWFSRE